MPSRNLMVMQSGGCTAVINRSLAGIIRAARKILPESRIYGADHGMEGLINGRIPDLTEISDQQMNFLDILPAAALGSTRHKLQHDDIEPIFNVFDRHNIGILHIIGGNDSAETGMTLSQTAKNLGYELKVVNVPKTIDNDLTETDHSPGYGSTARFVAQATFGAGLDAASMGDSAPITLIEVMGRDAGWLPAAASMYKNSSYDPPHFVGIPEITFDENLFLIQIEAAYRTHGYAVGVLSENIRSSDGPVGKNKSPWFIDDFGHAYYESPIRHLAEQVSKRLGIRCRYEKPGTIQRSLMDTISSTDSSEAHLVGMKAVEAAHSGETEKIVSLVRKDTNSYTCDTELAPLAKVAGAVRTLPSNFAPDSAGNISNEFKTYLEPLIGQKFCPPNSPLI